MQSHKRWLIKAENDLQAVKILLQANCLDNSLAEKLTPFGIAFRYPEEVDMYPQKQAVVQAVHDAAKILQFVEAQIKKEQTITS